MINGNNLENKVINAFRDSEKKLFNKVTNICKDLSVKDLRQLRAYKPKQKGQWIGFDDVESVLILENILKNTLEWKEDSKSSLEKMIEWQPGDKVSHPPSVAQDIDADNLSLIVKLTKAVNGRKNSKLIKIIEKDIIQNFKKKDVDFLISHLKKSTNNYTTNYLYSKEIKFLENIKLNSFKK